LTLVEAAVFVSCIIPTLNKTYYQTVKEILIDYLHVVRHRPFVIGVYGGRDGLREALPLVAVEFHPESFVVLGTLLRKLALDGLRLAHVTLEKAYDFIV
jgi:hypothetical protein